MLNQHFVWLDGGVRKSGSDGIESHGGRAHADHLSRTLLCRLLGAILLILKSDALIQLPGDAVLLGDLAFAILFALNEEIGAVSPALTAAYAAISID